MADLNRTDIYVQVRIREQTECGLFCDSLYYTSAEFATLSETDVANAVKTRTDAWVAFVKEQANAVPSEPTIEELTARKAELQAELDALNTQLEKG